MKNSSGKIESLTSLRFFMCMIVVIAHMEFLGGESAPNFFNYYLQNAAVAVDFFFVLSGFGLTLGCIRNPEKLPQKYSLGKAVGYGFGRVSKLYKVYLVTMLCAIPADLLEKVFRGQSVLAATVKTGVNILIAPTLLQSASGLLAVSHGLNGVAWFLSCLFILYMLFPLLEKLNKIIREKDFVLYAMAITFGLACVVHRAFSALENSFMPGGLTLDLSHGSPYMRVFHLFLGMLLADVVSKQNEIEDKVNVFNLNPIIYAIVVFTLNTIATLSEVFRSAMQTVDKGQYEAALCCGLTYFQALRRIILPQALVSAIPNICNLCVNLIKNTSLAFMMTVKDITAVAKIQASYGFNYIEAYLDIFIIYIIVCSVVQVLFKILEKRLTPGEVKC